MDTDSMDTEAVVAELLGVRVLTPPRYEVTVAHCGEEHRFVVEVVASGDGIRIVESNPVTGWVEMCYVVDAVLSLRDARLGRAMRRMPLDDVP
jgi:hypothetical protein